MFGDGKSRIAPASLSISPEACRRGHEDWFFGNYLVLPDWMIAAGLAFHLRQVAVLGVVALGGTFDELEKVAQVFAFRGFELGEFNTNAE